MGSERGRGEESEGRGGGVGGRGREEGGGEREREMKLPQISLQSAGLTCLYTTGLNSTRPKKKNTKSFYNRRLVVVISRFGALSSALHFQYARPSCVCCGPFKEINKRIAGNQTIE